MDRGAEKRHGQVLDSWGSHHGELEFATTKTETHVMLDGPTAVKALKSAGVTHIVWIPDSELGTWDAALSGPDGIPVIRVCREGEAFAVAAGLHLAGKKPLVILQCTGLFEAGDSLRNIVHDLRLPIVFIVGVRSYRAYLTRQTSDTCPVYTKPILEAWQLPHAMMEDHHTPNEFADTLRTAYDRNEAFAMLIGE